MRRTRLLASVLCLLWIGLASAGAAENQKDKAAAGSSRHGKAAKVSHGGRSIALLDITALFKADLEFKKAEEEVKADMARAEIDLKNEGVRLQAEGADVEKLAADSPQRSGRQSQLIRRKAEWQVRVQGLRDQFSQRQSKFFSKFYQKIHGVVDAYAKAHKLIVVINFSSNLDNPTKPTDVVREVGQPIVWHAEGIDITPAIAKLLEQTRAAEAKKAGSQPAAAEKPAAPAEPVPPVPSAPAKPAPCSPVRAPEDFAPRGAIGRSGRAPQNLPRRGQQGPCEAPRGLVRG